MSGDKYVKKFIIFGTGKYAEDYYKLYECMNGHEKNQIIAFTDNDNDKWGNCFYGKPIISPTRISTYDYDYICIWSAFYYDEILNQLLNMGIEETKISNIFEFYIDAICEKYKNVDDIELQLFLHNMKSGKGLENFYFQPKNDVNEYEVYYDLDKKMNYIVFEDKKMYLSNAVSAFKKKNGKKYFKDIWYEQDPNSPHLYEKGEICVNDGDVIVDVGACEGNFTLHNIEKVKKAYIIECDNLWVEALKNTFEPYKHKVEIINTYVSNVNRENYIRMDSLIDEQVDFIKMDIEGEEMNALEGAQSLFQKSNNLKCAICVYHKQEDEARITDYMKKHNMCTEVSKGYMLWTPIEEINNPELRHGVVRGKK